MAKLSQLQQDALDLLAAKIDPLHPGFTGTEEVRAALLKARIFLDSWALPLLDVIATGKEAYHGQRRHIAEDAGRARVMAKQTYTAEVHVREQGSTEDFKSATYHGIRARDRAHAEKMAKLMVEAHGAEFGGVTRLFLTAGGRHQ